MAQRSKLEKLSWIAGIVSAVIAAVALVVSFWPAKTKTDPTPPPGTSVSQTGPNTGNQIGNVTGNVTIVTPAPAPQAPQPGKLRSVWKPDIIGTDIQWFEGQVGPAIRQIKAMGYREYAVENCQMSLTVKNDTISAATLFLSPSCAFKWGDIYQMYADLPPPNQMTFGDLMKGGGWTFTISCLRLCGNSASPRAELSVGGSHAANWIVTTLGASIDSSENIDASSRLEDRITKEKGEDFVTSLKYQCDYDLNAAAAGIVEKMKVNYVQFRINDPARDVFPGDNYVCK